MSKITTTTTGIGTTETTIYTCPANKETTVTRFSTTGTEDVSALQISYYNSNSNNTINLIKNGVLNSGDTISYIGNSNSLFMNTGDYLTVISDVDSSIDVIITYEEVDV